MFGKVFASLYQGSLRGQAHEILVFTNMIACCDREGFIDKHPRAIAEEVGISIEEVRAAITNLEAFDPESRTPDEGGRRILRIDEHRPWGWRITNHLKYRDLKDEETRRETFRKSQRKRRASQQASTGVNISQPMSTPSTQAEAEAEGLKTVVANATTKPTYPPGFEAAWELYPHVTGRSKKAESLKVWTRRKLEPLSSSVVAWVELLKTCEEWTKDSGKFVPGFQRWIGGHDFAEEPVVKPPAEPTLNFYESDAPPKDQRVPYAEWLAKQPKVK